MNIWDKVKNYANGGRILKDWLGEGGVVVEQEKAQARANICLNGARDEHGKPRMCPNNVKSGLLPKAVAWAVHEELQLKNELQLRVDGEKALGKCSICDCQNRLKIWREIDKIRAEETEESLRKFPDWCWIRNEP